jgi:hypothetical protein
MDRSYIDINLWRKLIDKIGFPKASKYLGVTATALRIADKKGRVYAKYYYRLLDMPVVEEKGVVESKVDSLIDGIGVLITPVVDGSGKTMYRGSANTAVFDGEIEVTADAYDVREVYHSVRDSLREYARSKLLDLIEGA